MITPSYVAGLVLPSELVQILVLEEYRRNEKLGKSEAEEMAQSVKYLSTNGQNQERQAQLQILVTEHCVSKCDTRRPLRLTGQPTLLSQCSPASLREDSPKVK